MARILVLDDDDLIIDFIRTSLEKKNHEVLSATDGKTGLLTLHKEQVDLIISDIVMPEMDGFEFCRYCQSNKYLRDIPIMLVTAVSDFDKLEQTFETGAKDFINKPIQEVELLARTSSLLNLKIERDKRKQREKELTEITGFLEEKNQLLKRLAHIDSLTKIANRRYFSKIFNKEWKRAIRGKYNISILLIDIDYFKFFNDTYGHLAGDKCLERVAGAISSTLKRPADFVARYGGEEFIALLPNTDDKGALFIAEKIRKNVLNLQIEHTGSDVSIWLSVSIGISTKFPHELTDSYKIISESDNALYEAKNNGRNQVAQNSSLT